MIENELKYYFPFIVNYSYVFILSRKSDMIRTFGNKTEIEDNLPNPYCIQPNFDNNNGAISEITKQLLEILKLNPTAIDISNLKLTCYGLRQLLKDVTVCNSLFILDLTNNLLLPNNDPESLSSTLKLLMNVFPKAVIKLAFSNGDVWFKALEICFSEQLLDRLEIAKHFILFSGTRSFWSTRGYSSEFKEIMDIYLRSIHAQSLLDLKERLKYENLKQIGTFQHYILGNAYILDLNGKNLIQQTGHCIAPHTKDQKSYSTIDMLLKRLPKDYPDISKTTELRINDNRLSGECVSKLVSFIETYLPNLTLLYLHDNYVNQSWIAPILKLTMNPKINWIYVRSGWSYNQFDSLSLFNGVQKALEETRDLQYTADLEKTYKGLMNLFPTIKTIDIAKKYATTIIDETLPKTNIQKLILGNSMELDKLEKINSKYKSGVIDTHKKFHSSFLL